MAVLGTKNDGTVSECRATPENRGKGKCKHYEHIEIDNNKMNDYIKKKNEEKLKKDFGDFVSLKKQTAPNIQIVKAPSRAKSPNKRLGKNIYFVDDLEEESEILKEKYLKEFSNIESIENFCNVYENLINEESKEKKTQNLIQFFNSDNKIAQDVVQYLGGDANIETISEMLSSIPSAMRKTEWKNSRTPARAIMSRAFNDMSKNNYVKTVLMFKGKCCYCNKPFKNNNDKLSPTADHITPISPNDPTHVSGATKMGNMAMACNFCNLKKKDISLNTWMAVTQTVDKEQKADSLAKVKAFRESVGYQEFTYQEFAKINETINEALEITDKFKKDKENNLTTENSTEEVREKIDQLSKKLRNRIDNNI